MSASRSCNRIVFLTTLSVYLGLVLVGGTAQVSAQVKNQPADKNKISFLAPGEGYVFTFDLNPIIKLNQMVSGENLPIEISGKLVLLPQEFTNWEILSAKGNQNILDFLRKEFFSPVQSNPPEAANRLLPIKEGFQSVTVNKNEVTITRNTTFIDSNKAAYFEKCFRWMIDYASSPTADKEAAGNLYITNTQVHRENNQVFIVTHLPRASIDEFLAEKDAR